MKRQVPAGTTSSTDEIFLRNALVTNQVSGLNLTAAQIAASATLYYYRAGAGSSVAVPLFSGTLGQYGAGNIAVIDSTNMTGQIAIGIPNAALASGSTSVSFQIQGLGASADVVPWQYELTSGFILASGGFDNIPGDMASGSPFLNMRQWIDMIGVAVFGLLSGAGSTNILMSQPGASYANSLQRINATVDPNSNRTGIAITPPS